MSCVASVSNVINIAEKKEQLRKKGSKNNSDLLKILKTEDINELDISNSSFEECSQILKKLLFFQMKIVSRQEQCALK